MSEATRGPLARALAQGVGRLGFHMPGHHHGAGLPQAWIADLMAYDTTEILGLDDLNDPSGPAKASEVWAASVFSAGQTFYFTSGASSALKTAIASVAHDGGTLLCPPVVHRSVVSAIATLGLTPRFLSMHERKPGVWAPDVPSESRESDRPCALLITSPDYHGFCLDLKPFVAWARRTHVPLIVDEAHGAALLADPALAPRMALPSGADLVVHSAHKTLSTLTPGALLHIGREALASGRVDPHRVGAMRRVFQTSSPSFLIAATLEHGIARLADEGRATRARQCERVANLVHALGDQVAVWQGDDHDPLRLVIDLEPCQRTGPDVALRLRTLGIDVEMVEPTRLVLIVSLVHTASDLSRLCQALKTALSEPRDETAYRSARSLASCLAQRLGRHPRLVASPREALFAPTATVVDVVGQVAAEPIVTTPPCWPLIWPGERYDQAAVALLDRLAGGSQARLVMASPHHGDEAKPGADESIHGSMKYF